MHTSSETPESRSWPPKSATDPIAILISGGVDSAVLLGEALDAYSAVWPIYVRNGLAWEETEIRFLRTFLGAVQTPKLRPLTILEQPVRDIYGAHWSVTGKDVPDEQSPDEAVFLPGRNVLLLAKAMIFCQIRNIPLIAMAPLGANPFPDATPEFFRSFEEVMNRAIAGNVRILRPYSMLHKSDVLHRAKGLPLEYTLSCIQPVGPQHCGRCNKCAERRKAFDEAGLPDPTQYAD